MYDEDTVKIIRGRTPTSQNLLHGGFRYSKDGKLTTDGRQAWRCVRKKDCCRGRLYTLNESLVKVKEKRKKANSDKDRRIFSIVQNYHSYEDDVVLCEMFMLL